MEQLEFTVHGEGVSKLPSAIDGFPRDKRTDYDGDGFAVIVTEQYYLRTNSTLQTTTIFELLDDTTCTVSVVAGGGGVGLLQDDLRAESSESNKVVEKIREYCREHDLDIEEG